MKKQLIKEAFRLQQIAGLRPINEIFDTDNDQYLGKYSDAYGRVTVSNKGVYSAKDTSDQEAVRLADALTALYDEHGENGVDAWQSGAIDIEDYMESTAEGLQNQAEGGSISILKDLYYFDKLNMLAAMSDVDSKYHSYGSLVFTKGDSIQPGSEEYDMILDSPSLESNVHYSTGSQGMQKETSLSEIEDPGFEALIDDFILKIAQNYAEEGEDVEDYMGVAAEDAVELIRRKYRV